jgi:hypothetical protein
MKYIRLAGLLGLLIVSGGCENTIASDGQGTMWGMLDGKIWLGDAVAADFSRDTLTLWSRRRNGGGGQSLVIRAVQTSPGAYTLVTESMSADPSSYWEMVGDDGISYRATAQSGTIHFSRLDRAAHRAVGTVEVTVRGERGTSRFVRGSFDAVPPPIVD